MQSCFAATFLAGIGVGFAVAAPIGPMGILCIQRTLGSGVATGLATGFGAATVHLAYSTVATAGVASIVQPWIGSHALALSLLSGIVLMSFAVRMLRTRVVLMEGAGTDRIRLTHAYLSAVAIGITNPLTIVLFFAALQALANPSSSPSLAAGVFFGSAAWWVILSGIVATARGRLEPKMLALSSRLASSTLVAFGAYTLFRAVERIVG